VTDLILPKAAEESLSHLVISKTLFAKLDRPAGIIEFEPRQGPNDILNEWSTKIHHVFDLVVKANHLITKEEVVRQVLHSPGM